MRVARRDSRLQRGGVPGLVDTVYAVHAGSRGFDCNRRHMSERFFRSNRPEYPHLVCSELEIVVSEWRSVIAVSLNVGGGIKAAKLYMCTQNTTNTRRTDAWRRVVRDHGSVPFSHLGTSLRELNNNSN